MRHLVPFKTQDKSFLKSLTALEIVPASETLQGALTTKILQQLLMDFYDLSHDDFATKNTSNVRKKLADTPHATFLSENPNPSDPPPLSNTPTRNPPVQGKANDPKAAPPPPRPQRILSQNLNNSSSSNNSSAQPSPKKRTGKQDGVTPAKKTRPSRNDESESPSRDFSPPPSAIPFVSPFVSLFKDLEEKIDERSKTGKDELKTMLLELQRERREMELERRRLEREQRDRESVIAETG